MNLTLSGRVEKGEGMATRLGCPTANIAIEQGVIIPGLGVYVGKTEVSGQEHPSLVCINDGRDGTQLKMEVHLLDDVCQSLTGKILRVVLFEKLRDLVPFPGELEMSEVIAKDIEGAKNWFSKQSEPIDRTL